LGGVILVNNKINYIPNLNLNNTGLASMGGQWTIDLYRNDIIAIHPLLLTSLYNGVFTNVFIQFNKEYPSSASCVDPNYYTENIDNYSAYRGDMYVISQNNYEWILQNLAYQNFTTCYSSFTAEMGSDSLVTCGSPSTTTSTTSTTQSTTLSTLGSGSGQCATDKICRFYLDWNNQYTCVIDGAEGTVTSISGTHYLTFIDTDVTRLYFINSNLNLVPKVLFIKFPNLKYLHIANSGLTIINKKTFNECGKLEFLDASHNEINHIDDDSLRNCTMLRVIDLTGNPIDYVSAGLYQLDPTLERVHLKRLEDWILA
jgi:hypothetical protein